MDRKDDMFESDNIDYSTGEIYCIVDCGCGGAQLAKNCHFEPACKNCVPYQK